MPTQKPLRVAALIDLPRTPLSGGHVKGWERLARAAAASSDLPLDLTVYFSGADTTEILAPHVKLRHMPPVFSTERLKFIPYVPDHTDLAPYHAQLARELKGFDVIHTTDGFFAFTKTAERVSRRHNIPLVTSFHTDTPGYARVFTRKTIETIFKHNWFARFLTDTLRLPERQEAKMLRRLRKHVTVCSHAIGTRPEDLRLASEILGGANVSLMRAPVDRGLFDPELRDRSAVEVAYNIPPGRVLIVFSGRLDEGKNIYTLIGALEKLIAEGLPVHLITAGIGPAEKDLHERLKGHVSVAGFVQPGALGRIFASADILAHPSEVEIRGLTAMEGLVSGLPVLVSHKAGLAALYGHPSAMISLPSDIDAWADALRDLIASPERRDALAQEALAYAHEHVPTSLDIIAQDLLPIWQQAHRMQRD